MCYLFLPSYLGTLPETTDIDPITEETFCVGDVMKPMATFFLLESFVYKGVSYYRYRWRIFIASLINSVVNFSFERVVISWCETRFDRRFKDNRAEKLKTTTEGLKVAYLNQK